MDAVTYPHDGVVNAINESFVAYKINMSERHSDYKEACAGARVSWGPTFVIADARGNELRRWTGWLPPESFVAELAFCRAYANYTHGKFAEAVAGFAAIVERDAGTEIHPEALYWQGAAGFMAGPQDWDALRRSWTRLVEEYPQNRFGTHARVIEDAPASS
jgi:TolA-binding protein